MTYRDILNAIQTTDAMPSFVPTTDDLVGMEIDDDELPNQEFVLSFTSPIFDNLDDFDYGPTVESFSQWKVEIAGVPFMFKRGEGWSWKATFSKDKDEPALGDEDVRKALDDCMEFAVSPDDFDDIPTMVDELLDELFLRKAFARLKGRYLFFRDLDTEQILLRPKDAELDDEEMGFFDNAERISYKDALAAFLESPQDYYERFEP